MELLKKISEITKILDNQKNLGKKIGFVPTMGYLHEGHKSLIEKARKENDIVVVSVYVNPKQFAPGEDFDTYPRDIERDYKLCEELNVDYIFAPSDEEMYTAGFDTYVAPSPKMMNIMCGISRPIFFIGICTVVTKLFNIIKPDKAYFGEKDAQQLAIIKRMVKDFNIPIKIVGCPIVREEDGLAKSSRNVYLNEEERKIAPVLRESMLSALQLINDGERSAKVIFNHIADIINSKKYTEIDYVEIVNFDTFDKLETLSGNILIAMAVKVGTTRLIDNTTLTL